MSDTDIYAKGLSAAVSYTNTYYHTEPKLDITAESPPTYSELDFVISSDVFEHIKPPTDHAFRNLRRMLRVGGSLVFSVPYSSNDATIEHFPNLDIYNVVEVKPAEWVLLNRTRDGTWEVHENLVFHGGPGSTLEMRVFSESDVLTQLRAAEFQIEYIYDQPMLDIGYYWPPLHERDAEIGGPVLGYVISARAV
jgi:hypothetical protein